MAPWSWTFLLLMVSCFGDHVGAADTFTITPDTVVSGAQPSYWNVTLYNLAPVAPGPFNWLYWSTAQALFVPNPSPKPVINIAGCRATFSSASGSGSLMISLPSSCALGGTVSFLLPQPYLAVNPRGNATVSLLMGSTTLWARIRYNLAHSPSSPSARVGLSIVPDTVDAGARPSYWNVTVENINYVAPHWFNIISFSTSKDVFRSLGSGSADIDMAGCNASVSSGYSTSVLLTLDDNCGVGGTFSFIVPGSYFTVNPGGLVTVTLRIGSDTLRTNITYTRAPTLTIVPDSVEPGALASSWRVTVENAGYLDPTSGSTYLSFDTNRSAFSNSNGRYPDVAVGGCTATRSPFFFTDTALTFSLSPGCTLGGTFSFLLPGEYLASNPGGPMAVKLTFGWTTLRTTVVYAGPAVFSVVPETVEPGAQAAHWSVTATDLAPVAPRPLQYIYLATCCGKTVFVARSTATPFGIVGGCATTSTATFSTLLIYLPDDCGLRGGTLSFAIPGEYLAPNPAGNVSLYLTVGSNALSSSIAYEGSRSPGNNPNQPMLLSVAPATAVAGAQAAYWRVTVVNLDPVAPGQSRVFYLATSTAAFQRHPAATPLLSVAGCSASATSTLTTALYFTLASDCGYGGTFSFQVPGDYLAPNPTGDVSVTLSIGVNTLKTVITFIASPRGLPATAASASPAGPAPGPSPPPSPLPLLLSVAPDTTVSGAQAMYWTVTVTNLDPVASGEYRVFYLGTSTAAFRRHPSATPLLSVAGCSASATSTLTTALYFTLASDCGYGGTFSFQVPGDYLAPNPTGDVSVTLSIGVNTLKTVIVFTGPSPSPLHDSTPNPTVLPSPAPVSRSKESTADITNSDLLLMILVGAILCVLLLLLVLAVLVYHFIRHTHPVGDERYLLTTSGRLLVPVATGVEFLTSGCFANCPAVGIPTGSTSV